MALFHTWMLLEVFDVFENKPKSNKLLENSHKNKAEHPIKTECSAFSLQS
jgi:hypothetical protein